jgi:protein-S-isoprenylcysteine O-methyltransferase Ste14
MNATITKNKLRRKILLKGLIRFILVFIFIGILLFVPAGSLNFFNGWLFIAGLFVPMTFALIYLYINDPELLEKRINLKEKEDAQKKYIKLSMIFSIVVYIIPGLDYRFNWSDVPMWFVLVSLLVMICGYIMFIIVMLQNRYASRVIEIQDEQKLIDTGLYSIVRHPMYLSATILYVPSSIV